MLAWALVALRRAAGEGWVVIDLGADSMRVALVERGKPVSVVINAQSRRSTPAVATLLVPADAGILSEESVPLFKRYVGDAAAADRHGTFSARWLPFIMGKNYSDFLVDWMNEHDVWLPFDADEDGYLELVAAPEFFASQLIGAGIGDAKRGRVNFTISGMVLVVPKFLTHHQRVSFVRAGRLVGHEPWLIEGTEAVGTLFALDRTQLFNVRDLCVCFVDVGASQAQVSIQAFHYEKARVRSRANITVTELGYGWTDQFGGWALDRIIAKKIKDAILAERPGIEIDKRAHWRIMAAAKRIKHDLTIQSKVTTYLEDLVRGYDFHFTCTAQELGAALGPDLAMLNATFQDALSAAELSVRDIDRIELVGGGTRSPAIANFVAALGDNTVPVGRSLNSEEAVLTGAGYAHSARVNRSLAHDVFFRRLAPYAIGLYRDERRPSVVTFAYDDDSLLPIGISPFIRTVDLGQQGRYDLFEGMVKVRGSRRLTRSGLTRAKRERLADLIRAFDRVDRDRQKEELILNEFQAKLVDIRDKLSKDPIVAEVCTGDERRRGLEVLAEVEHHIVAGRVTAEDEINRSMTLVNRTVLPLLKRAHDKAEGPASYEKLDELVQRVQRAVLREWPAQDVSPKRGLMKKLAKATAAADRFVAEHRADYRAAILDYDEMELMRGRLEGAFEACKRSILDRTARRFNL